MRRLLIVALPLGLGLMAALATADPTPPDIEALIRQLGDKSFEVRQAATEKLLERPDAAPALRKALKSDDPEVARRAEVILGELPRRGDKQALARLEGFARNGEIDRAIELLVRRQHWADEDAAWQAMTGLADRLIDLAAKEFGEPAMPPRQRFLPAGDYAHHKEKNRTQTQTTGRVVNYHDRQDTSLLVRAEEIEAGESRGDLLVSTGAVRRGTDKATSHCDLLRCVVFAIGPVEVPDASDSIIVCDGDVKVSQGAMKCLIVARGDVYCHEFAPDCRIVASGQITLPKRPRSIQGTKVKEKEPNPLGFVKWFDPASVGVVVEQAEGGVRVKQADEGKPFARAGLRAGDLAVAADGKKIDSPDTFRRLLRARVVMGEKLTLDVRRDGKTVKLAVDLAPPEPPKE